MRMSRLCRLSALLGLIAAAVGCGGSEPRVPTPVTLPVAVTTAVPAPTVTPASTASISFLGSKPEPGSTIPTIRCYGPEFCADLEMGFEVSSPVDRSSLMFLVELRDSAGNICGDTGGPIKDLRAARAANVTFSRWELYGNSGCTLFNRSSTAQSTALVDTELREGFQTVRRERFEVRYTFIAPPLSQPAAPEVVSFCWRVLPFDASGWAGSLPQAGEDVVYSCVGEDTDGDAVSVSIDYESTAGCLTPDHCWTSTTNSPPRVVPLPIGGGVTRKSPGGRFSLTCRIRDSHGFQAERTIRPDQSCHYP
jgi:hypothetical protein